MRVVELGDAGDLHVADRPRPQPDHTSAPFWAAAATGRLLFQRCPTCGHAQFYPRPMCTRCASPVEWEESSGDGSVHTFTVVRQNLAPPFAELGPYVVAMVELAEGPRMLTNVTHVDPGDVRIGLAVRAYAVRLDDDVAIPFFRPAPVGEAVDRA
jgi:uncharacterized OB-fold protein